MDKRKEEDIKGLFEQFADSKEPEQAADDIRQGEQILREHPAVEPDAELIAGIKAEIGRQLSERRTGIRWRIFLKAAAIAAVFAVLSAIGVRLFEQESTEQVNIADTLTRAQSIWESENIADADEELAVLSAETQQIESELLSLELGENGDDDKEWLELEMELIENSSDFWKG